MRMIKFLSTAIAILMTFNCYAEQDQLLISRSEKISFEPQRAFFIIKDAGKIIKLPVRIWIPDTDAKYFASYYKSLDGDGELQQALMVFGANEESKFFPFKSQKIKQRLESTEKMKSDLQQYKDTLDNWNVQLRVQGESLERLRTDAEIIGNLGRIAEKTNELQRVKTQSRNLERDMENLNHFLSIAGQASQPVNFLKRQTVLTEQLGELAKAARDMESGERGRKNQEESDLQRDLRLVESTRDDNYEELSAMLKDLQREHVRLEDQLMR